MCWITICGQCNEGHSGRNLCPQAKFWGKGCLSFAEPHRDARNPPCLECLVPQYEGPPLKTTLSWKKKDEIVGLYWCYDPNCEFNSVFQEEREQHVQNVHVSEGVQKRKSEQSPELQIDDDRVIGSPSPSMDGSLERNGAQFPESQVDDEDDERTIGSLSPIADNSLERNGAPSPESQVDADNNDHERTVGSPSPLMDDSLEQNGAQFPEYPADDDDDERTIGSLSPIADNSLERNGAPSPESQVDADKKDHERTVGSPSPLMDDSIEVQDDCISLQSCDDGNCPWSSNAARYLLIRHGKKEGRLRFECNAVDCGWIGCTPEAHQGHVAEAHTGRSPRQ